MFISLWVFSITLAASAVFILAALNVPAVIILLYTLSIISSPSASLQETTFNILVTVWSLSPGLILSGE